MYRLPIYFVSQLIANAMSAVVARLYALRGKLGRRCSVTRPIRGVGLEAGSDRQSASSAIIDIPDQLDDSEET